MRIGPLRPLVAPIAAMALAAAALAPAGAAGDPTARFYERSVLVEAQGRCALFEPRLGLALRAGAWQARGDALRAGADAAAVRAAAAHARTRVSTLACDDADLAVVSGRVRTAFQGWLKTPRMTFPGVRADWRADRYRTVVGGWRLVQGSAVGASPVGFGLADGPAPSAVVAFKGAPRPWAARIVTRDPALDPAPWLNTPGPAAPRRMIWAVGQAPADAARRPPGARSAEAWTFPEAAARAVAELDPREGFTVEFLFRDDSIARARFEAGDFAAARAFLAMGPV